MFSPTSLEIDVGETKGVSYITDSDGTNINVSKNNTNVSVSRSGTTINVTGENAGESVVTVSITGGTNYNDISRSFNVEVWEVIELIENLDFNIELATVDNISDQTYTGSQIMPVPTVSYNGTPLVKNMHYSVSWGQNINVGTGTVIITAIEGNGYFGSKTVEFNIVKAAPMIVFSPTSLEVGEEETASVNFITNSDGTNINVSKNNANVSVSRSGTTINVTGEVAGESIVTLSTFF